MDEYGDLTFKLACNGDIIFIIVESTTSDEWLKSRVEIKAGAFGGAYQASFMFYDFSAFRDQLKSVSNDLGGIAKFDSLESQLQINIKGDGFGHFIADCVAMEKAGYGNELRFELNFDQTYIPALINQLDYIIDRLS